jgi:hypothetical protein
MAVPGCDQVDELDDIVNPLGVAEHAIVARPITLIADRASRRVRRYISIQKKAWKPAPAHEASGVHHASRRRSGKLATHGASATGGE